MRTVVFVSGDIGRSPRMQFHALSLAQCAGHAVDLVGLKGPAPYPPVLADPNIRLVHLWGLQRFFKSLPRFLFLLAAPFRLLWQFLATLWVLLFTVKAPNFVIMQNPPALPYMLAVYLACRLRGATFVVDWHNFTYSILELRFGTNSVITRLARWFEVSLGRRADESLCVSKAMRAHMVKMWDIHPTVLYDCPPAFVGAISLEEKHDLMLRYGLRSPILAEAHAMNEKGGVDGEADAAGELPEATLLTEINRKSHQVVARKKRPFVMVTSTSYTPDEDLRILLRALNTLDRDLQDRVDVGLESPDGVQYVVIITGRGPMKEYYRNTIMRMHLRFCAVRMLWLDAGDYFKLLSCADVGISLHFSSSALDLPMKVVDMFGAGTPVLALKYQCIDELVHHGSNGMVFKNSVELVEQIRLLSHDPDLLDQLREGAIRTGGRKFFDEWTQKTTLLFPVVAPRPPQQQQPHRREEEEQEQHNQEDAHSVREE